MAKMLRVNDHVTPASWVVDILLEGVLKYRPDANRAHHRVVDVLRAIILMLVSAACALPIAEGLLSSFVQRTLTYGCVK